MTDLKRLMQTFDVLGIKYDVSIIYDHDKYDTSLVIGEGQGYTDFFCAFHFKNFKFVDHAVKE